MESLPITHYQIIAKYLSVLDLVNFIIVIPRIYISFGPKYGQLFWKNYLENNKLIIGKDILNRLRFDTVIDHIALIREIVWLNINQLFIVVNEIGYKERNNLNKINRIKKISQKHSKLRALRSDEYSHRPLKINKTLSLNDIITFNNITLPSNIYTILEDSLNQYVNYSKELKKLLRANPIYNIYDTDHIISEETSLAVKTKETVFGEKFRIKLHNRISIDKFLERQIYLNSGDFNSEKSQS